MTCVSAAEGQPLERIWETQFIQFVRCPQNRKFILVKIILLIREWDEIRPGTRAKDAESRRVVPSVAVAMAVGALSYLKRKKRGRSVKKRRFRIRTTLFRFPNLFV